MLKHIIFSLILSFSSACALVAHAATPVQLADNAPDRYVVQRGDTLWGIAGKFVKDPWRWPEIWRMNREQIRNPHRIFPGQIVVLDRSGPYLRIGGVEKLQPKVYEEKGDEAIPSIPQQVIAPFLAEPLIVEAGALDQAPKIIGTQDDRVYLGPGDTAFATGIKSDAKLWQLYRKATPIRDPETSEIIAYEATFLGTARLAKTGDPATIEVVTTKREIGKGDRLMPASVPDIVTYAPHAPSKQIDGRIVKIFDGIYETGRNYIVTLNRGTRDGIEIGHVLAIHRNSRLGIYGKRDVSVYREDPTSPAEVYQLPDERYGLVFVFRTFERVSYALVMSASRPVSVADLVRTP